MATPVLGDRESKEFTVYQALDRAFISRISRCFDSLCNTFEEEQAVRLFVDRFKRATDSGTRLRPQSRQNTPKGWS